MPSAMAINQMGGGQQMRPNQVDTQKLQKQASKDNTPGPKRSKSLKSEAKVKKDGQTKSPTVKRPKEIQYSRLLFIQHYFNGSELKNLADDKEDAAIDPMLADEDKDAAQNEDEKAADGQNKEQEEDKNENDDEKKEGEEANQIDSSAAPKHDDETAVDDRGEEFHEQYEDQQVNEAVSVPNPYENDEPLMLEINSKSKSKCLKKVILEKKNLEGS